MGKSVASPVQELDGALPSDEVGVPRGGGGVGLDPEGSAQQGAGGGGGKDLPPPLVRGAVEELKQKSTLLRRFSPDLDKVHFTDARHSCSGYTCMRIVKSQLLNALHKGTFLEKCVETEK